MHKTPKDIIAKKAAGKKISVVTAYDYSLASLCDRADVDILLVGDSSGMVMLGYDNTIPVTMTHSSVLIMSLAPSVHLCTQYTVYQYLTILP